MVEENRIGRLLEQLAKGTAGDPDAEWKAAIALGDIESPSERQQAVVALISALSAGRSHALVRTHAAESLGRLGDRQAVPSLIAALQDPIS
jgi:HEAT repeat protein